MEKNMESNMETTILCAGTEVGALYNHCFHGSMGNTYMGTMADTKKVYSLESANFSLPKQVVYSIL